MCLPLLYINLLRNRELRLSSIVANIQKIIKKNKCFVLIMVNLVAVLKLHSDPKLSYA